MHVVVLTDKNEMYVWGRNDQAQLGDSPNAAITEPTYMSTLHGKTIIGVACGPSQVIKHFCIYFLSTLFPNLCLGRISPSEGKERREKE